MRKVLLWALAAVAAVILVLVVVVAIQPAEFRVTRSATIKAPAPLVFEQVNNLHNWEAWSPWAKLDPNAENSFEGPEAGEGAVFRWSGNDEIGAGSMTVTRSVPHERVHMRLDFERPMPGTADTEFAFQTQGDATVVTWTMIGENNFIGKAMCLVMDIDQMVGSDFEEGLASMRAIAEAHQPAEAEAQPAAEPQSPPEVEAQPRGEIKQSIETEQPAETY